jgi:hypothetical protein
VVNPTSKSIDQLTEQLSQVIKLLSNSIRPSSPSVRLRNRSPSPGIYRKPELVLIDSEEIPSHSLDVAVHTIRQRGMPSTLLMVVGHL